MVLNLSWIDRNKIRELVAQTAWRPPVEAPPTGLVDTALPAATAPDLGVRRFGASFVVADRHETLASGGTAIGRADSHTRVPAGSSVEPPTQPRIEPVSTPRPVARVAVRTVRSATAPARDTGSGRRPSWDGSSGALPAGEAPQTTQKAKHLRSVADAYVPERQGDLAHRISHFLAWARAVARCDAAFVADQQGLAVATSGETKVEVAVACVVEQALIGLDSFLPGRADGHLCVHRAGTEMVLSWSHCEYGRFFLALIGHETPAWDAVLFVVETFRASFSDLLHDRGTQS